MWIKAIELKQLFFFFTTDEYILVKFLSYLLVANLKCDELLVLVSSLPSMLKYLPYSGKLWRGFLIGELAILN